MPRRKSRRLARDDEGSDHPDGASDLLSPATADGEDAASSTAGPGSGTRRHSNAHDEDTADELREQESDKSIMDFLENMDSYQPVIPDAVLDHYFGRAGLDCPDVRVKRFLALAAQKFISDIAQDSYQYCKIRQQGMSSKDKKNASKKNVLTMEDLSAAMAEYGVNARRPDYYT
eukprot:Partr_v1_DN24107_c1_g2_i1_m71026 putative TAF10 RNA polymerase II, TATA box binding protein (TBP)-associated factor